MSIAEFILLAGLASLFYMALRPLRKAIEARLLRVLDREPRKMRVIDIKSAPIHRQPGTPEE